MPESSLADGAPLPSPGYGVGRNGNHTTDTPAGLNAQGPAPGFGAQPFAPPTASPFNQPFVAAESQGLPQPQQFSTTTQEGDPEDDRSDLQHPARREDTQPGYDPAVDAPAGPPRRPAAFFAMVGAAAGMAAMAVLLFAVGAVAFPAAVPAVDYGVVAVTTTPAGAAVVFDGAPLITPAQVAMPLDGQPRTLAISLPGYKDRTENAVFSSGQNTAALNVTLEPQ